MLKVQSVLNPESYYDLQYDKLVIGVGALSNTFNTPGVVENAFFLKVRVMSGFFYGPLTMYNILVAQCKTAF